MHATWWGPGRAVQHAQHQRWSRLQVERTPTCQNCQEIDKEMSLPQSSWPRAR